MKKVMLIHHSGLLGGAGISFLNLIKLLGSKEYNCQYFIPSDPCELKDFYASNNVYPETFSYRLGKITYYSGGNSYINLKFYYHALRIFLHFSLWKRAINDFKPDLIIVNSIVIAWFSLILNKISHPNIKSICFVRETKRGSNYNPINLFLKSMLSRFSAVVFLSEFDKEAWSLANRAEVLRNYSDNDSLKILNRNDSCQRLGIDSNSFNLVFVGGYNHLKGTLVAIKALDVIVNKHGHKNVKLIIAGNKPPKLSLMNLPHLFRMIYFWRVKKYIKKHNLHRNIFSIGVQSNINLLYSSSDLLISSMIKPHQARPLFEFGFHKKPAIISNFKNINEMVKNPAMKFKPKDHNDLALKIISLYKNKKLYSVAADENYNNSLNFHTQEKYEFKLKELLDQISK